jgi:LPS sulfotransferase NodH
MLNCYSIIAGARTGSTHLCDLLTSTGRLGNPSEYFNEHLIPSYESSLGGTPGLSYVDKIISCTASKNGVVGIKLSELGQLLKCYKLDFAQNISRWIWLRREDKIAQAVSTYLSWETDIWDYSRLPERREVSYSKEKILSAYQHIIQEEALMEVFLMGRPTLEIYYEKDVCSNPEITIEKILSFLEVPGDNLPTILSQQKSMSTKINQEFIERFKIDLPSMDANQSLYTHTL